MKFTLFTAVLFSVLSAVHGKPLSRRQSITALTTSQIDAYTPYTYFASAAYCAPSATLAWNCGANCDANSDFIPYASGGDGDSVQYCELHAHSTRQFGAHVAYRLQGMLDTLHLWPRLLLAIRELIPQNCQFKSVLISLHIVNACPITSEADLTDVEVVMSSLDSTLFPGLSSSIEVHDGFQDEQAE
ncbi:hypothetical protein H0H92_012969 [Tricholoma furcatifolium]|nr:hypothetical protein H0H92_012969 [Tricholoma furcatifolium]